MGLPGTILLVLGISLTCRGDFTCLFYENEVGWRCSDGECIIKDWVCDSHQQCVDNSDETLGCNLFNETGCNSWQGRRHVKCPNNPQRCVEDVETDCPQDESVHNEVSVTSCPEENQWRCNDGLCIPFQKLCDGHRECKDGSDETEGCQLYPSTLCQSWNGQRHIQCALNGSIICTLPEFELAGNCRGCSDGPDKWRCDNGLCIDSKLVKNGLQDCHDGSDENTVYIKWWTILLITMAVTLFGILASYLYRGICQRSHFFSCDDCQKKLKKTKKKGINQRSKPFTKDYVRSESLMSESHYNRENILPLRLIELLDSEESWRKKSLSGDSSGTGKQLYAEVHQNTVLYHNLYQYLTYKYSRREDLSRRLELLRRWELDFHGGENHEVLKCWRLHLGMCDVLKHVVTSVEPSGILSQFYGKVLLPIRNAARRQRKGMNQNLKSKAESVYTFIKTTGLLVRPFLGASALYFDICKDVTFAYLIFKSLGDLTNNDFFNTAYAFEMALPCYFVVSIVIVQIFFAAISYSYATEIFELCEHHTPEKRHWLRVFVLFFFWPLMPAFILANHVYFSEQEHSLRRNLETCDAKGEESKEETICKTSLFVQIQNTRYRSQLHRRIYSFYRITLASIESMTLIVILILISIVCPRSNRKINLLEGVQSKIGDFLGIKTQDYSDGGIPGKDETILSQLGLAKDVVFGLSISFSFVMVITAFARYIYQSKGKNVTIVGQFFLGLYFAFHCVARLTVSIAMFSTAEASDQPRDIEIENLNLSKPKISLLPSAVIALTLFVLHFVCIYWFKLWRVPDFRLANKVEQLVHVLANTVVVVPFMNWDVGISHSFEVNPNDFSEENCNCLLKRSASVNALDDQKQINEKKTHRRVASDVTGIVNKLPLCRVNSRPGSKIALNGSTSIGIETEVSRIAVKVSQNNSSLKDTITTHFERIDLSFAFADVKGKILRKWWEDPSRDLSEEEVLSEFAKLRLDNSGVEKIYRGLVSKGFINRDLYNPLRTKSEFFWLLIFQLVVNFTALVIEVVNGGVQTAKGMYFSWDVRLGSFFLGIVFLALYYRKYHMLSELTGHRWCGFCWNYFPVYCCIKKDKPMHAIPLYEEIERCLELPTIRKTVETQTSIIQPFCPHSPTKASDNGDKKMNKEKLFETELSTKLNANFLKKSAKTSSKDRQVTLV